MNNIDEKKCFITNNVYIASVFISEGHDLAKIERLQEEVLYIFVHKPVLQTLSNQYYLNKVMVPANIFVRHLLDLEKQGDNLKSRYSVMDGF